MKRSLYLLLLCLPILLPGCHKEKKTALQSDALCYDFEIRDSATIAPNWVVTDKYLYNSNHQLVHHITYQNAVQTSADSFAYDKSGNMVKSWMSLGANTSSNPYTTSVYTYSANTLVGSQYFYGTTLLVHSVYTYDALGRMASYTQYTDNQGYGLGPNLYYQMVYNQDSKDISQILGDGGVVYSYLNYDNSPNPYYKLPFDYAYNIFASFKSFSPNNYQVAYSIQPGVPGLSSSDSTSMSYNYTYNKGQVVSFLSTPSNGRVSNGPGSTDILTIRSLCQIK